MSIVLLVAGVLVVLVLTLVVLVYQQPKTFQVQRSATTTAASETIYTLMSDLHRYREWSPWEGKDPAQKTEIHGAAGEAGASYSWDGNNNVGAGTMTITEATPNQRIVLDLNFTRPFDANNQVVWQIEDSGNERRVVWTMHGTNDTFMQRAIMMFMNMDRMVGPDFEKGLANLKQVVEKA